MENCVEYLCNTTDTDSVLDIIELSFHMIQISHKQNKSYILQGAGIKMSAADAVKELETSRNPVASADEGGLRLPGRQ